ncbi:hypothetical protein SADUNF_Sadunf11G0047700 [Salix dunnii]|uniref:non-specific serine/threonine protein kinase n=1 Tax=Salix dunnii TaxID=1413687 RepID=A0A835JT20_9ROSI|nr:hypothetical protein SADUNF_Sadunf11G0047700 [Salix dunnii]
MMFQQLVQVFQVMVIISFSSSVTSLASLLPPGEVAALRQIGKTLNEDGQVSLSFVDLCESAGNVTILRYPSTIKRSSTNNTISELKDNDFSGRLPPDLAKLTYVEKIDLTRNYLNGTIQVEWASMKNLSSISLTANRLSGNIPGYLGNFTALTYLSLESNQFSGVVPPELGKLASLETLILSSNKLVGTLPEALAQIKDLTDFRVSDNNLNGTVPEFIGNWTQLRKLDLCATGLQGPVPPAIFLLKNLKDLRIADTPGPEFPLPIVPEKMNHLVLRNINLSGTIPKEAWDVEKTLDLTFNKLVGELPSTTIQRQFTFLSGNMLTGTVQEAFIERNTYLDVSYNNLTWSPRCSDQIWNLSDKNGNCNMSNGILVLCAADYRSFHINCGSGQDVKNGTILYEGEPNSEGSAAARNYYRPGSNWGFSSTGDFMYDDDSNGEKYTLQSKSNPNITDFELYTTARRTPLSITYYGYCLENGDYTVRLHFAEIQFLDEIRSYKAARRVFNIYIQGKRVKEDFNIKEAAKESNRDITIAFNTTVINSTLEIRLYWAGKGSTVIPRRGDYGPIISAISVCSEPEEASKKPIVIGVVTSAVFLIFLVMGIIYWKFCYGHKHTRERELKGLDLKTGSFTLRQLKAATENFNSANKIGEGGFGSVYKGELADGTIIAVKQLSSKSRQGNRYMAPEYALWGYLTEKADVYSFGVVALEIVSGKSNSSYRPENENVCLLDWAFVLKKKGNLMEVVDPKLQSEFNKEEAERMIKLALLCTNASPSLRPAMSEAASMLEGQTSIPEMISDPSIYGNDLHSTRLTGHYQQARDHSLNNTQGLFPPSDKSWNGKSSTSAHDLYPVNPESINLSLSETSSLIE